VRLYGDHHILLTIADNFYKGLPPMRQPEVRERLLRQAWEVFGLNPKHAKAEKLRWFRFPAPRNTLKKPVTYPHIYCEAIHVLPPWITEMLDESWKKRIPLKLTPGAQRMYEWQREYIARLAASEAEQQEDADVSNSSGSTTASDS
jgi:hypothetical protein